MSQHMDKTPLFRKPELQDGTAIYRLIQASPPLDLNSIYLYFLQASHFADTCVVVEQDGEIVGFLSAYLQPDKPQRLFVWQVAVAESLRGQGLGKKMLLQLLRNQLHTPKITEFACTISPSNKASQRLFESFAQTHHLVGETVPFITRAHFGETGHEAEDLYVFKAPDNEKLIHYIFKRSK